MKKRMLSILLCLVMVVGLLPTTALAAVSTPGSSADNPVVCTTYTQFKAAMENWDVAYVKIKNINEVLPSHNTGTTAVGAYTYGPSNIKYLLIEGSSTLTAPMGNSPYQSLIYIGSGCKLYVSGNGNLTFKANTNYSANALIENHGQCTISENVTLTGTYNSAVYGYAIASTGTASNLTIKDGTFYGGVAMNGPSPYGAVWIGDRGKATISGGTFKGEIAEGVTLSSGGTNNALIVDESADCTIKGQATFMNGIYIKPTGTTSVKKLPDLLGHGYCMVVAPTSDSQCYFPASDATKVDERIWVEPKPFLQSTVTVNGEGAMNNGSFTDVEKGEVTVTVTYDIPTWVSANSSLTTVPELKLLKESGTEATESLNTSISGGTVTAKFTPTGSGAYFLTGTLKVKASGGQELEADGGTVFVKIKVEAQPPQLTGTVTYIGAALVGETLTAEVTDLPEDLSIGNLSYQWQRKEGISGNWTNISGKTSASYTLTAADNSNNVRVVVSAAGYTGSIYGAAKLVSKAPAYGTPVAPVLSCAGTTITFTPQVGQEYCYTTTAPAGTPSWPVEAGTTTTGSFEGTAGSTYYVYTRIAGTTTTLAGTTVRVGSITVPSSDSGTDNATGLSYPDYPTTREIYVPINGFAKVRYQITPAGANADFLEWAESPISETPILSQVSAENGELKIYAGSTTGATNVKTYKSSTHDTANLFGTDGYVFSVHVYDPDDLAGTVTSYNSTDLDPVTLYVGDTYTLDLNGLKNSLDFLPKGVSKEWYTLKAYIFKPASGGSMPQFVTDNTYISIDPDTGKITAKTYAEGNDTTVYLAVLAQSETTANVSKYAATLNVKVATKPTVALDSIAINPTTLTLRVGETFNLGITKDPVDATDTITWTSNETSVATVDSSTGKVTAVTAGSATISATSSTDSTKTATCTVTVKPAHTDTHTVTYVDNGTYHTWACNESDCGATGADAHTYGAWIKKDGTYHKHTCANCSYEETETHNWEVDSTTPAAIGADGSIKYKCDTTGCTAETTVTLPALTAITTAAVTVTAPVRGATPATASAVAGAGFSVNSTTWTPTDATFAASTVYTVTVQLVADSGKGFNDATNFTINGNAPASKTINSVTSATLTYTFPETGSGSSSSGGGGVSTYAITVEDAKNGDVKADRKSASSGTTVTITVDPDKGYTLETLTVLDKNGKEVKLTDKGNGKYTFKMPASKVTVKAAFAEDNSMLNFFVDVPVDAYYYDAVLWAAENGITGGVDAVHFAPNAACTRAQIVTFLWRAAGSPEPKAVSSFTDVSADAYYAKAVAWAVENGITGGIGGNKFAPDATCTRAQAVTFLYRAAGSPAVSSDAAFSDVGTDAYYANAVAWVAKEGITGGIGGGLFGSDNDCTRAQIVTFLYRSVK